MHYLKSFVMTLSLFVLIVPVIHAGDVEDINSMVKKKVAVIFDLLGNCLLYTSPSPRDAQLSRMPSSA